MVTAVLSAVFIVGSAVQNFVIVDEATVRSMMELAGGSPEEAASAAPGFVTGFRVVGCLHIVGNAVGVFAGTGRTSAFVIVILVNLTQAAGLVVIPPEMFEVAHDRFGGWRLLSSLITDGGAALLSVALIGLLIAAGTAPHPGSSAGFDEVMQRTVRGDEQPLRWSVGAVHQARAPTPPPHRLRRSWRRSP